MYVPQLHKMFCMGPNTGHSPQFFEKLGYKHCSLRVIVYNVIHNTEAELFFFAKQNSKMDSMSSEGSEY